LGAARGQRLRKGSCASFPTRLIFLLLPRFALQTSSRGTKACPSLSCSFASVGLQTAHYNGHMERYFYKLFSYEWLKNSCEVHSEALARQVAAINTIAEKATLYLLVALVLSQMPARLAQGAKPALPKLKTETQEAFERYVRLTDARNEGEWKRGTALLWVDGLPEEQRAEAYAELKRGEVRMQKLEMLDNGKPIACPGGMIHHWTGVVFIPAAKLQDVLGVLEDYDRHSTYYAPDVERSKIESLEGDDFRVFLRFRRHKVITVVLDTEHEVQYYHDAPGKAHSSSSAVRIAEVENAGKSDEREKPPGDDDGFMWRMETWWRMEERDGGVYVQSEVASLTREIPTGLGWMIKPFVTDIPKESLTFTLEATRKAVEAHRSAR
jgi:hypothetical protein